MFAVMKTFVTDISAPCQSHISNIKSFLPVEAEISVAQVFIATKMKNSNYEVNRK
jgi:hypothetical protein